MEGEWKEFRELRPKAVGQGYILEAIGSRRAAPASTRRVLAGRLEQKRRKFRQAEESHDRLTVIVWRQKS